MRPFTVFVGLCLLAVHCLALNTLNGAKYRISGPNPIPVNNALVFGGWRCNSIIFGAAVAAAGANNQGAGVPGIYFYYNNIVASPTAFRVIYIGKSAVNIGQRLGAHRRNDHFCSGVAAGELQQACGYCWFRTAAAGTVDYDTYFYEALLLLSFCASGNDPLNGGKWGAQVCIAAAPPNVGGAIIQIFNNVFLNNLPAILAAHVNAVPPSNDTKTDPIPMVSEEHHTSWKGAAFCEYQDYYTVPTNLSNSLAFTLISGVQINGWIASLNSLSQYLSYDRFSRQIQPQNCVPQSNDEVVIGIISYGIAIWGPYVTHGAQLTRVEFYGTFTQGDFQSSTSQTLLYIFVSNPSGQTVFLIDFEMTLVADQPSTSFVYSFENPQQLLSDIQVALKTYYGSNTQRAAADYTAIFNLLDKTLISINQCVTQPQFIQPPPNYCSKCLQGLC